MIIEKDSPIPAGTYSSFTVDEHGKITSLGPADETGFESGSPATVSTLSFDNATRTLTLAPIGSYSFWANGKRFTKSSNVTKQITDTEGVWSFYFDESGELQAEQGFIPDSMIEHAFVASVYWDASNNQRIRFSEERHGRVMSTMTHLYLHRTFGTQYGYGLGLGNFSADGNGDSAAHAQFSVADGTIWDEDLSTAITDGSPQDLAPVAQIPMFYRTGASGDWRKFAANGFAVVYGGRGAPAAGARANWNQFTGGVWQLTEVAQLEFLLTHIYATNDLEEPVIGICGQATYATLSAAQAGAVNEVHNLSLGGMIELAREFTPIGTIIWQTSTGYANTSKSRVRTLDSGNVYQDWRRTR